MKKINKFLFLSIFVLAFCTAAFSQKEKNLDKYKSRTLSEISLINREATDEILRKSKLKEKQDFISYDLLYSRIRVEFTGQQRTISQNHQELIKIWGKLQNIGKKKYESLRKRIFFQGRQ